MQVGPADFGRIYVQGIPLYRARNQFFFGWVTSLRPIGPCIRLVCSNHLYGPI